MNEKDLPGLLPCPFCGSDGACLTHRAGLLFWNVECAGCRSRGPETRASAIGEEERISAVYNAKRNAIEGWNRNRRTPETIRAWMEREEQRADE
ncbi:MAG: hypothetical protein II263_00095 [Lachnospiraceae bacterium]|nr:hypothetical protein [Lachnospiraceae bacterium]